MHGDIVFNTIHVLTILRSPLMNWKTIYSCKTFIFFHILFVSALFFSYLWYVCPFLCTHDLFQFHRCTFHTSRGTPQEIPQKRIFFVEILFLPLFLPPYTQIHPRNIRGREFTILIPSFSLSSPLSSAGMFSRRFWLGRMLPFLFSLLQLRSLVPNFTQYPLYVSHRIK